MKLQDLTIAVVTHEYFKGTGQELRDYLTEIKISKLYYVAHMFSYIEDSISYLETYEAGEQVNEIKSPKFPRNEFLMYLRDAIYTLRYFLFTDEKIDIYVGVDSFNAIFGLLLKKLGKVDTVVFVTIDYIMHDRFSFGPLNWLYVKMDRIAFFGSDYTWNVSDRMSRQRIKEIGEKAKEKPQLVVPIGVPIDEVGEIEVERKDNVIVYSGSLTEESGVELAVEAMPRLVEEMPNVELRIIGLGPLEEKLKHRAEELKAEENVNFVGYIDTNVAREKWLRLLKESTLGLAPYKQTETTYKQFSDVTKPKDYMACKLPVITTAVIPLSEDIKKHNLGRVIEDDVTSFVENVSELLQNEQELNEIRGNVYDYSKNMTWESVFDRVFEEMGVQV